MQNEIFNQIKDITSKLISVGLSVEQNFPSKSTCGIIYITDKKNLSISLKNIPYIDVYNTLNKDKNYNIKLIDGALLQIMYVFKGNDLLKYKLAFFPCPILEEFQNNPEIYEHDEIYADILKKNIVSVPVRFDYDPRPESCVLIDHPKSHLTIGQYKNCRIPVSSPITPSVFIQFILRNFYNSAFKKYSNKLKFNNKNLFSKCIENDEEKILHFSIKR